MIWRCVSTLASWVFSLYALWVALICNLATWPFLLLVPGLARRQRIARLGTRMVFQLTGIGLSVGGRTNVPHESCVVVANHRSYFDGLALICALPPGFSPLIKDAVRCIPGLGTIMARAGSIYVRRTPAAVAGYDTLRLIRRVKTGASPAIFAEGTLSPDQGLLPLRDGAFLVAVKTGRPVVPVAIQGSRTVLKPGGRRLRHGRVRVTIGRPCYPEGRGRQSVRKLRENVESELWALLSPATAGWRATLSMTSYYANSLAGIGESVVVDLDTLAQRLRSNLGPLPAKPLRLDTRVICDPAVARRILRSDVRVDAALCVDFKMADDLLSQWEFKNVVVAPSDGNTVDDFATQVLERHQPNMELMVAKASSFDRLDDHCLASHRPIRVWLYMPGPIVAGPGGTSERQSLFERCAAHNETTLVGVLLDYAACTTAIADDEVEADIDKIHDGAAQAGLNRPPVTLAGPPASGRPGMSRSVAELVVGKELISGSADNDWPLALQWSPAHQNKIIALPSLASENKDADRIYLYGGRVVASLLKSKRDQNA